MSFFAKAADDGYGGIIYNLTPAGYTALVLFMLAALLLGCAFFGKQKKLSAKQLAFSAVAIALAFVTSNIKFFHFPMGGSITLCSMLFVTLIGYWFGLGAGLTCGFAYGVLQLVIDPYIISFPQMLLDYIFAFGALGLSGLIPNKKLVFHVKDKFSIDFGVIVSYLIGVLGRFFFSFLSGWIFFGIYASDYGFNNEALYSFAYNGTCFGAEALLTVIVLVIPPVNIAFNYIRKLVTNE